MHLMYVDESGDTGFPAPGAGFPSAGGPTKLFVRAGVIVHGWKWCSVNKRISDFKQSRDLQWNQEIKAHDLRSGGGAFSGWRKEDREVALRDLVDSIGKEIDVSIIGIIIDKTRVDTARKERLSNPAVRSFELLLEQYSYFLAGQRDKCGVVILDSVEQRNDDNLRYFQSYLREFSNQLDARRVIEGALFMPSHTTNMLQIADICSNVIYRYYRSGCSEDGEFKRISSRIHATRMWP